MDYYNSKIQLDRTVIEDIITEVKKLPYSRMLVFGLGYDSELWYHLCDETYFIEDDEQYIRLSKNKIPNENIIPYKYPNELTVKSSFNFTDEQITSYALPKQLESKQFDIILIDGPKGYDDRQKGRLLPIYWSTMFKNAIVYVDDYNRKLETYCVNKYYSNHRKTIIQQREGTVKIYPTLGI